MFFIVAGRLFSLNILSTVSKISSNLLQEVTWVGEFGWWSRQGSAYRPAN